MPTLPPPLLIEDVLAILSRHPNAAHDSLMCRISANIMSRNIRQFLEAECCQICGTSGRGTRKESYLEDRLCNLLLDATKTEKWSDLRDETRTPNTPEIMNQDPAPTPSTPMEYFVVCSAEPIGNLLEAVRAFIKDGWTPQGGVSAVYFPGSQDLPNAASMFFYQAMIREGKL